MKKVLTACFLSVITITVLAQSKPKNTLGLTLGWQNFKVHDPHAAPLVYGTNSVFPALGLSYRHQNQKSLYEFKLSGTKGALNPLRFGARNYSTKWSEKDSFQYQIASAFFNANIEAAYYWLVPSLSGSNLQTRMGGRLNEAAYFGDEVANFPWLMNTLDLAPALMMDYQPAAHHRFGFKVDLAAVGLVTRSVYSIFAKSNKDKNVMAYLKQGTRLATINHYQKINFQFDYSYRVNRHFELGAVYQWKWLHYSVPRPMRVLDKRFDIRFAYTY